MDIPAIPHLCDAVDPVRATLRRDPRVPVEVTVRGAEVTAPAVMLSLQKPARSDNGASHKPHGPVSLASLERPWPRYVPRCAGHGQRLRRSRCHPHGPGAGWRWPRRSGRGLACYRRRRPRGVGISGRPCPASLWPGRRGDRTRTTTPRATRPLGREQMSSRSSSERLGVGALSLFACNYRFCASTFVPSVRVYYKKAGPDAALPPGLGGLTRATSHQMRGPRGARGLGGVHQQEVCPCPLTIVSPLSR